VEDFFTESHFAHLPATGTTTGFSYLSFAVIAFTGKNFSFIDPLTVDQWDSSTSFSFA
jgi:hypothetical protein